MQEKQLFEYAVIRLVPRVEREEFLNVGVILYCSGKKYLDLLFELDEDKIKPFCPKADLGEIREYLNAFKEICKGNSEAGPIGKLPVAERFRWITATRSTIIQTSKVHPGLCDEPGERMKQLFRDFVL